MLGNQLFNWCSKNRELGGDSVRKSLVYRILVTALALALAFTFVACGVGAPEEPADQPADQPAEQPDTTPEEPAPEPEGEEAEAPAGKKTYAIVYPVIHQFFDPVTKGAEEYAEQLGDVEL